MDMDAALSSGEKIRFGRFLEAAVILGRNRDGFRIQIPIAIDYRGRLLRCRLTEGLRHDIRQC